MMLMAFQSLKTQTVIRLIAPFFLQLVIQILKTPSVIHLFAQPLAKSILTLKTRHVSHQAVRMKEQTLMCTQTQQTVATVDQIQPPYARDRTFTYTNHY